MKFHIGLLDYTGAQKASVYGLLDLFEIARRVHREQDGPHELEVWRCEERPRMPAPRRGMEALIIPPSLLPEPPGNVTDTLRRWILKRYAEGTILCSVCVGAFILAEVGVLEDRTVTTHWTLKDTFAARYPDIHLDTDRLLIDDGDIWTAGGLMAWVDLGLRLVERFLGAPTMLQTARALLVDPGGREQRFYSTFAPLLTHGDDTILKLQRWLQGRIGEQISVPMMAKVAGLGHRTLLRRFQRATGLKTSTYMQHLRIAKARELLESTMMSQQEIAWDVGYSDAGPLRKAFLRWLGLSPGEYRRRFHPRRISKPPAP